MKKEINYFLSILLIFTFSVVSLFTLFKKYSGLTFEHFRETYKVIASSFFSTGAHYVGFILTAIVLVITIDWFLPKIVVSTKLIRELDKNQLEAVILHEYYHLKNLHPLLLIVGEILSSSLLLLPILRDLTGKMRTVL